MEWEIILANISDKELIVKIDKEVTKFNNKNKQSN